MACCVIAYLNIICPQINVSAWQPGSLSTPMQHACIHKEADLHKCCKNFSSFCLASLNHTRTWGFNIKQLSTHNIYTLENHYMRFVRVLCRASAVSGICRACAELREGASNRKEDIITVCFIVFRHSCGFTAVEI